MSSSAEQETSAVSPASRLENLRRRGTRAAEDDFLRELGKRLSYNPSQARRVAPPLGLEEEQEKDVKALAVLGAQYPDVFREILRKYEDAVLDEEDIMPETRWGQEHYRKIARKRMEALWGRIFRENGIVMKEELESAVNEKFVKVIRGHSFENEALLRIRQKEEAQSFCPALCGEISQGLNKIYIFQPCVVEHGARDRFIIGHNKGIAISIRADTTFMYIPPQMGIYTWNPKWQDIYLTIADKKHLHLANKLAAAHERETRRRRSPARAVVVKNY